MNLEEAVQVLSRKLSRLRGIHAVYGGHYSGRSMIVVSTTHGTSPPGMPQTFMGFPVVIVKAAVMEQRGLRNPTEEMMFGAEEEEEKPGKKGEQEGGEGMGLVQKVYLGTRVISSPFAVAMSYKRNKSIFWAAVHGLFIPNIYLAYAFIDRKTGGAEGEAKKNPNWKTYGMVGGGTAVLGAGGFVGYRYYLRSQLRQKLEASELVKRAVDGGHITESPADLAALHLPLFAMTGVDEAYVEVMKYVQKKLPPESTTDLSKDLGRGASGLWESLPLPDIPGIDVASWFGFGEEEQAPAPAAAPGSTVS